MAKGKKKRRSKKKGGHSAFGAAAASAGSARAGRRGRHPSAKAKQAYYKNVRKAYSRLKKVAESHGFA